MIKTDTDIFNNLFLIITVRNTLLHPGRPILITARNLF